MQAPSFYKEERMVLGKNTAYILYDWWLDCQDGFWHLHGNNDFEKGNPRFARGEIITTSQIVEISINGNGILFKSKNSQYFCRFSTTIEMRYDWFGNVKLWELRLDEKEMQYYTYCLRSAVEKRQKKETGVVTELPVDEYCLLAFGSQYQNCFADAIYCKNGEINHYMAEKASDYWPGIMLIDLLTDLDRLIYFETISDNTIKLKGATIWYMPTFISNYGNEDLLFDTVYGRFSIPPDGKLYEVSGKAKARKVAVYSDEMHRHGYRLDENIN